MSIRISAANAITNLAETMNLKRLVSNSMQSPPVFSFGGHRCQSVGRFLIIADSGRLETGGLFLCPFPDGKPPKDSGSQVEAAALDFYSCRMAAYFYIGRVVLWSIATTVSANTISMASGAAGARSTTSTACA